jgi:uncharacterized DUF497 family protein
MEGWAFEWDEANIAHIARHRVTPDEVEEATADADAVALEASSGPDERREGLLTATAAGRILAVVFTERADRVRIVTARRATRSEQDLYRGGG